MIKPPDGLAIEATGLVKTFGKIRALDGIVLAVPPASCTRCWARTERARDHGDPGSAGAGALHQCAPYRRADWRCHARGEHQLVFLARQPWSQRST
jgi:hypothetical protein